MPTAHEIVRNNHLLDKLLNRILAVSCGELHLSRRRNLRRRTLSKHFQRPRFVHWDIEFPFDRYLFTGPQHRIELNPESQGGPRLVRLTEDADTVTGSRNRAISQRRRMIDKRHVIVGSTIYFPLHRSHRIETGELSFRIIRRIPVSMHRRLPHDPLRRMQLILSVVMIETDHLIAELSTDLPFVKRESQERHSDKHGTQHPSREPRCQARDCGGAFKPGRHPQKGTREYTCLVEKKIRPRLLPL